MTNTELRKKEHLEDLRDYCISKYKLWNGSVKFSLNELLEAYAPVAVENNGKYELSKTFDILELARLLKKAGFDVNVTAGVNDVNGNYVILSFKPRLGVERR